jgi:hypothetical protein
LESEIDWEFSATPDSLLAALTSTDSDRDTSVSSEKSTDSEVICEAEAALSSSSSMFCVLAESISCA